MEQASSNDPGRGEVREAQQEQTHAARRELLATIGRFVYVAPALALLAEPKAAQAGYGVTRPGYGYGDQNHIHTGPPGLNK